MLEQQGEGAIHLKGIRLDPQQFEIDLENNAKYKYNNTISKCANLGLSGCGVEGRQWRVASHVDDDGVINPRG